MPRKKDPELVQINVRLRREDVEQAKKIASEEGTYYHEVIREWVRLGRERSGKVV